MVPLPNAAQRWALACLGVDGPTEAWAIRWTQARVELATAPLHTDVSRAGASFAGHQACVRVGGYKRERTKC